MGADLCACLHDLCACLLAQQEKIEEKKTEFVGEQQPDLAVPLSHLSRPPHDDYKA
jgi:hypothetical protein